MNSVFISYSSKDRDFVLKLAEDLKNHDFKVWIDAWEISGRLPFWEEIQQGVESCSHFLFVISPDSIVPECGAMTELYHAYSLRPLRVIVPVMARTTPFNKLPMIISPGKLQIYDFSNRSYADVLANVIRALESSQQPALSDSQTESVRADTLYKQGAAFLNAERYEQAIEYYTRALEVDTEHFLSWFDKGRALLALGQYEESIRCFIEASEINSQEENIYSNIGMALNALEKYEEAIQYLDRSLSINPHNTHALTNKSQSLGNLQRHSEAGLVCDKILEINPYDDMAWNNKGASLGYTGRFDEAVEYCRKALQINPGNELAKTNLARWLQMKNSISSLLRKLSDADNNVRLQAAAELANFGESAIISILAALREQRDSFAGDNFGTAAALVFVSIGDPAVPALKEAMYDSNSFVAACARMALGLMGKIGTDEIFER